MELQLQFTKCGRPLLLQCSDRGEWPAGTKLVLVADRSVLVEQRSCGTASRAARCSEEVRWMDIQVFITTASSAALFLGRLIRNTAVLREVLHGIIVLCLGHDGGFQGETQTHIRV